MASYRGHLAVSSVLGAAYGAAGLLHLQLDWGPAFLAFGLTTVGGLLPDLDSDSGVPVRELFGLAGAFIPILLIPRLRQAGLSLEQMLVILGGAYLFVRYGLARFFKQVTVHRGMFHSIPALGIAGLAVYLLYHSPDPRLRYYLAGGAMLGFLSHLILDEMFAVDFTGATLRLNRMAGSAFKLTSPSILATFLTYCVLLLLGGMAWMNWAP